MNDPRRLPLPELEQPCLGFLRLADSAPLIMARELGLFDRYGLDPVLKREVSWANVRDKLACGELDAAAMLAPLPLAAALGVAGPRTTFVTGLALSLNGNAISVSAHLAAELRSRGANPTRAADSSARALAHYLEETNAELTFASAHTFSCHTLQLRAWLASAGIDPDRDVRIIVLPPEQMVDSLSRGAIDGYCVGEPWNTVAVRHGLGEVQATGYQIANNAIEKVLAVTERWHGAHPGTHLRLRLALMEACAWLSEPVNREQAASIMAHPDYLDLPAEQIQPCFTGRFQWSKHEPPLDLPHFHVFGRFQAGFPWRSEGEYLLRETGRLLGREIPGDQLVSLVQQTYRTDLYREAARFLDLPCPSRDHKPAEPHDGPWELEPGVELGPDRRLPPAPVSP